LYLFHSGGTVKAVCNYCKTGLSAASQAGTNHLRRHADKCFLEHGGVTVQRQSQLSFTGRSKVVWIFSQDESRDKLARMFIKHKYPFSMAEHEGFIDFMQTVQPQFTIPGWMTLRNNSVKLYGKLKLIEMAKMAQVHHIGLTTDLWTSSDLTGYMVITVHYITNE
jgi:hypothetical protein